MTWLRFSIARALAAALLLSASVAAAQPVVCDPEEVLLSGPWGSARFSVEIADDPEERARGLMFRQSLPGGAGMLFVYDYPQRVSFWMRNTLIPLDMLFIDARGVVQHIHHNAIPRDETSIPGGDNRLAVLEINGGLSRAMGITVGTAIRHPAFGSDAALPCAG